MTKKPDAPDITVTILKPYYGLPLPYSDEEIVAAWRRLTEGYPKTPNGIFDSIPGWKREEGT